jgi:hypothetical protein
MTINLFGMDWNLLALTIYLLTVFFTTNLIKVKVIAKTVFLSWVIGAACFAFISLIWPQYCTFIGIVQFVFLTLLLNGGVKAGHLAYDFLASKFTFLKERDRHFEKRTGIKL